MTRPLAPTARRGPRRGLALAGALSLAVAAAACRAAPPAPAPAGEGAAPLAATASPTAAAADASGDPALDIRLGARRVAWREGLVVPDEPFEKLIYDLDLANERANAGQFDAAAEAFLRVRAQMADLGAEMRAGSPVGEVTLRLGAMHLRAAATTQLAADPTRDPWRLPGGGATLEDAGELARARLEIERMARSDPNDLAARWLQHVARVVVGAPMDDLPERARIDAARFASEGPMPAFADAAHAAGVARVDHGGGTVLDDLDGDGRLDLLVSSAGPADPMALYLGAGDGTFRDATAGSGLEDLADGIALAAGDFDEDGDRDVFVARGGDLGDGGVLPDTLLRNEGEGRFVDVTAAAGLAGDHPTRAAAWGDLDGDGLLDLFVGRQALRGADHPNALYRNAGDGTFVDVAAELGAAAPGPTSGVALGDVDDDGDLDVYLSRRGAPNLLLRNAGRGPDGDWRPFEDVTAQAGVSEPSYAGAARFLDFDDDGDLDLFVAGDGRAVEALDNLVADVAADVLGLPARADRPRLYRNRGDGTFEDVTREAGLWRVLLATDVGVGDLDGDGREDLFVATGDPDLRALVPHRVFRNAGDGTFQDVTTAGGFGHLQKGAAVAMGDVDGDGDLDVHVNMGGVYAADVSPDLLYVNPGGGGRWLTLRLEGTAGGRDAIGARVRVELSGPSGGRALHRVIGADGGSRDLEIGLGDATSIEAVTVRWPGGAEQTFRGVPLDAVLRLREGEPEPEPVGAAPALPRPRAGGPRADPSLRALAPAAGHGRWPDRPNRPRRDSSHHEPVVPAGSAGLTPNVKRTSHDPPLGGARAPSPRL